MVEPLLLRRSVSALSQEGKRSLLAQLSPEHAGWLARWGWFELRAREAQLPPQDDAWRTWLILAGRGFGKTRTGAETVRYMVETARAGRIALVGRTAADARDVMVEGESGILACSPDTFRPRYEPSKRRLTWPNGAMATTYSGDKPDQLRGPQHDFAWADELAAWRYDDSWDQLMFGLRLGKNPRSVATTTPRNRKLIKELLAAPSTRATRGSTYDNRANLPEAFLEVILKKYEGTRLGRQELWADILEDAEGALWKRAQLDANRVNILPTLERIEIGVDPAVTSGEDSDETGIIIAGLSAGTRHGYVLEDLTCKESPDKWARKVVEAYHRYACNRVVAEVNNGGDLVETVIKTVDPDVVVVKVHAAKGKRTRAEPVAALYEQGRVHHLGTHAELEDECCNFTTDFEGSPNHMDALVWVLTDLMIQDVASFGGAPVVLGSWGRKRR